MEERTEDKQMEVLARIHNHLVELKSILVETELSRTGTPEALKTRLKELTSNDELMEAGHHAAMPTRQKVIAPTDTGITPGEAAE